MKSIEELSLHITEEEYHELPQMNYSSLSKFNREGFSCIKSLKDNIKTPSIVFGSAVDCLLTSGEEEFNNRFIVYEDIPAEALANIIQQIYVLYSNYESLNDISDEFILNIELVSEWYKTLKDATKLTKIKARDDYFKFLKNRGDKEVLDINTYNKIVETVNTLKTNVATHKFFEFDNPFNEDVKRYYQLKFTTTLNDIEYKIMIDELIVDYKNKSIIPIDLKTSSNKEYEFYKSFIKWGYQIQARLYYRVLREVLDKDDYFKDFTISDYLFVVINKESLNPLVWKFEHTKDIGELDINGTIFKDPEDIAKELCDYIKRDAIVPNDIKIIGVNKLEDWI